MLVTQQSLDGYILQGCACERAKAGPGRQCSPLPDAQEAASRLCIFSFFLVYLSAFIFFFLVYLFIYSCPECLLLPRLSLAAPSGGCAPGEVRRLLTAVVYFVAEHQL